MSVDADRLSALLGGSALARLRLRVRSRLAAGVPLGVLTLTDPTAEERLAVERLIGRIARGQSVRVDLAALEHTLCEAGVCPDLRAAVETLDGPLEDPRALRAAEQTAWRRLFADTRARLPPVPAVVDWLAELEATGLLRRSAGGDVAEAEALLADAGAVLRRLPAVAMPLAELAAETTANTHGLDVGQPLSALVLRALARIAGLDPPTDAETRRQVWAAAGVLCDELSAPVLVLNLPALGVTTASRALALHAETGEPYRISTRQLLRTPLQFPSTLARVFVCENPTVVAAAADRLGPRCAPLVCTDGQPKTAFRALAGQLASAGATLRYHGDFDWPGIQMVNLVVQRHGAQPWRMAPEDYLHGPAGPPLEGEPIAASWSEVLTAEMQKRGCAVQEEHVLPALIEDLVGR